MKIRWTKDSVRFRITPSELAQLQNREIVTEKITFPVSKVTPFSWYAALSALGTKERGTRLVAMNGEFMIELSKEDLARLVDDRNEGVYFTTNDEPKIRYSVEKDFPCAHPRAGEAAEPVTETFVPPPDFDDRKRST